MKKLTNYCEFLNEISNLKSKNIKLTNIANHTVLTLSRCLEHSWRINISLIDYGDKVFPCIMGRDEFLYDFYRKELIHPRT
jgi:hypothetical protein